MAGDPAPPPPEDALPAPALVALHDPVACLSRDALVAEIDTLGIAGVALDVTVAADGDTRVVSVGVRDGGGLVGTPTATFAAVDCPHAPEVVALKVEVLLSELRPWLLEPTPLVEAVELPVGLSFGGTTPWDLRAEAGARLVLAPGRARVLVGSELGVGTVVEVGPGAARFAEGLGLVGVQTGPGAGRLEVGAFGGAVVAAGVGGLAGEVWRGTAGGWVGITAPVTCALRLGLGARVYAIRLGVCPGSATGEPTPCPDSELVSEPWVRTEARLVPAVGPRRDFCGER